MTASDVRQPLTRLIWTKNQPLTSPFSGRGGDAGTQQEPSGATINAACCICVVVLDLSLRELNKGVSQS